jgi:hypothetical protein
LNREQIKPSAFAKLRELPAGRDKEWFLYRDAGKLQSDGSQRSRNIFPQLLARLLVLAARFRELTPLGLQLWLDRSVLVGDGESAVTEFLGL